MDQAALGVSREREFWTPPPDWCGEIAFVLASGPSMSEVIAAKVRPHRTIVVNSTVLIAPWSDIWFFTDTGVYQRHKDMVRRFAGRVVSMSKRAKREQPDIVSRITGQWMDDFPGEGSQAVRQGRSSGQTAISIAVAHRPLIVGLLGFDMRLVDGREHHHGEYKGQLRDVALYEREFVPALKGWCDTARAVGVEIINCTPGSAVTEFPFADLDEVLSCARS